MCSSDLVSKEVNSAKCASIGALTCGILACLGFFVGGWPAGLGGILATIASSMLLCCGPTARGQGKGMHTASLILYVIGAVACALGIIFALVAYFTVLDSAKRSCSSSYDSDACVNLVMGFAGLFVWPAVILATLSAAMDIWGAVTSFKAMGAIDKEISTVASTALPATGIPVASGVQLAAGSVP